MSFSFNLIIWIIVAVVATLGAVIAGIIMYKNFHKSIQVQQNQMMEAMNPLNRAWTCESCQGNNQNVAKCEYCGSPAPVSNDIPDAIEKMTEQFRTMFDDF